MSNKLKKYKFNEIDESGIYSDAKKLVLSIYSENKKLTHFSYKVIDDIDYPLYDCKLHFYIGDKLVKKNTYECQDVVDYKKGYIPSNLLFQDDDDW